MKRGLEFHQRASTSEGDSEVPTDSKRTYQGQSLRNEFMILDGSLKHILTETVFGITNALIYKRCQIDPQHIYDLYMDFLNAGANIIRTNTTEAFYSTLKNADTNELTLADYNILIAKNVELATTAVNDYNRMKEGKQPEAIVVGSCGHLYQTVPMTKYQRIDDYRCLIKALSDTGITHFCLESIQSTSDAEMLVDLLKELNRKDIRTIMMFKLNNQAEGFQDGTDWTQTAYDCYNNLPNTLAIGINCMHRNYVKDILNQFFEKRQNKLEKKIPLVVCVDKSDNDIKMWHPFGFIPYPIHLKTLGVHIIGGCCKVNSDDILEIHEELEKYNGRIILK